MKHNVLLFLCLSFGSVTLAQDGGWKVVSTEVIRTQIVDGKEIELSRTTTYADGVSHDNADGVSHDNAETNQQVTEVEASKPEPEPEKVEPAKVESLPAETVVSPPKEERAVVKAEIEVSPEPVKETVIIEEPAQKEELKIIKLNVPSSFIVENLPQKAVCPASEKRDAKMVVLDGKLVPLIKRGDPTPANNAFVYEDLLDQPDNPTISSCTTGG